MPLHSTEASPKIRAAARALQARLNDAGKENLIEMVIKFYTFSHIAANAAKKDANWLRPIIQAHDQVCGEPRPCDPNFHRLIQQVLRPKYLEKVNLRDRVLNTIWEALGSFNDEDAAVGSAAEDNNHEGEDYEDAMEEQDIGIHAFSSSQTAQEAGSQAARELMELNLNRLDREMGEESDLEGTDGWTDRDDGTDETVTGSVKEIIDNRGNVGGSNTP
ncbi:MAG: hypothetical protein Q9215_002389 [Flavoplaca cf. flavocitrina]